MNRFYTGSDVERSNSAANPNYESHSDSYGTRLERRYHWRALLRISPPIFCMSKLADGAKLLSLSLPKAILPFVYPPWSHSAFLLATTKLLCRKTDVIILYDAWFSWTAHKTSDSCLNSMNVLYTTLMPRLTALDEDLFENTTKSKQRTNDPISQSDSRH